jgi:chemotaxis protein methyltransferase CheR
MDEFFGPNKSDWDTKVLATDISSNVLSIAKAGIYAEEKLSDLPAAWKKRYFKPYDGENQILCERIRNESFSSKLNLWTPVTVSRKIHAIFCRNVMIYFDNETKDHLDERLYDITEPAAF